MENAKRLYRSMRHKVIGGVCGGLADYLGIDVVLLRIGFVLLVLFGGSGVLVYLIMWIAIPSETNRFDDYEDLSEKKSPEANETQVNSSQKQTNAIVGAVLIFFGLLILFHHVIPFMFFIDLWPLILVVVGLLLLKPDLFSPVQNQSQPGTESENSNSSTPKNL